MGILEGPIGGFMFARYLVVAMALAALSAGAAAAQAPSPAASAIPNAPAAAGVSAPSTGSAASAAASSAAPDAAKPTSEIGRFGNFVGSPSTGSDDSSPAPVPGSPPTAPR